jgi:hypothetical protein
MMCKRSLKTRVPRDRDHDEPGRGEATVTFEEGAGRVQLMRKAEPADDWSH